MTDRTYCLVIKLFAGLFRLLGIRFDVRSTVIAACAGGST